MTKKRITKWEQNRRLMEKARVKALAEIDRLENQGYRFTDKYKERFQKPIGKRPTTEQRKSFQSITRLPTIRTHAISGTIQRHKQGISFQQPAGAPERKISLGRSGTSDVKKVSNLGRQLLNDMKYLSTKGKRKSVSMDILARQLDQIGKLSGMDLLSGETPQKAAKHMIDVLNKLTPEKLGTALTLTEFQIGPTAIQMLAPLYSFGATPAGAKALENAFIEESKQSLSRNLRTEENIDLSPELVDKIYDFFDSDIWEDYRKDKQKYTQEDVITLAREVKQNQEIDIDTFLQIVAGAPNIDIAVALYRWVKAEEAKQKAEEAKKKG